MRFAGIALLFLALLVLASANAQAYTLTQHAVNIEVNTDGTAKVTEKFVLSFGSQLELDRFREQARKIGADLDAWKAFDGNITNYVGTIKTGSIGFEESEGDRFVTLEYQLQQPLFLVTETGRYTQFALDSSAFEAFRHGSIYIIPSTTKIVFILPKSAIIDAETLKPSIENPDILNQTLLEKRIFWTGQLSISGNLVLNFQIEKQIVPSVSITQTLQEMVKSGEAAFIAAIILIVLGMMYFKRKSIQQKIENYLVEHTALEHKKETEEIEIEE